MDDEEDEQDFQRGLAREDQEIKMREAQQRYEEERDNLQWRLDTARSREDDLSSQMDDLEQRNSQREFDHSLNDPD